MEPSEKLSKNGEPTGDTTLIYKCDVCNVSCNAEAVLEAHNQGKNHLRNVELIHQGEKPYVKINAKKKNRNPHASSQARELIDDCQHPIVGLDHVTEHTKEGEPEKRYICDLCDAKTLLGSLISHLTGIKHRREYLKIVCREVLEEKENQIESVKRSDKNPVILELTKEMMAKHGKGVMKIKKHLDPFYTPPNPNNPNPNADGTRGRGRGRGRGDVVSPRGGGRGYGQERGGSRGRGYGSQHGRGADYSQDFSQDSFGGNFGNDFGSTNRFSSVLDSSSYGPPAKKSRLEGTIHHVADIVLNNHNLIVTEEDASLALQVSNSLTNSLLQFRLNSMPAEVTETVGYSKNTGGYGSSGGYNSGSYVGQGNSSSGYGGQMGSGQGAGGYAGKTGGGRGSRGYGGQLGAGKPRGTGGYRGKSGGGQSMGAGGFGGQSNFSGPGQY